MITPRKVVRLCKGTSALLDLITALFVTVILILLISIVIYSIFMRYVQNNAPGWTEEVSLFLIVYVVFIAGRVALNRGQHVGITFIVDLLPKKASLVARVLSNFGTMTFMVALAWYGYKFSIFFQNFTAPATGVSMFWLYVVIPVGAGLMALEALILLIRDIAAFMMKNDLNPTVEAQP